jgi:two-component system, NtrC family, response regulator HydG
MTSQALGVDDGADPSRRVSRLLGTSEVMRRVRELVECAAESDAAVLITGESGTGKELVAREVHALSRPRGGPFVVVGCAAVPERLLERELFGFRQRTVDDTRSDGPDLWEAARGGTVFLDEVGDLPLGLQETLLKALQGGRVPRWGGRGDVPLDVRIISATSRDTESAIESGCLRPDLYYRLNAIHIDLPPLRARGGDLVELAQRFLDDVTRRVGKSIAGFTRRATEQLLAYDWPGNVRELRNCIERVVALARGDEIALEDLPERIRDYRSSHLLVVGDDPSDFATLEDVERRYILRVIDACNGNKSKAARILGIGRKTLYRRLESFGIEIDSSEL